MSLEYKSFITTKRKLDEIENSQITNRNQIDQEQSTNDLINNRIRLFKPIENSIKKIQEYSTDWIVLENVIIGGVASETTFFGSWDIDLGQLPEMLLPYLFVRVVHRNSSQDSSLILGRTNHILELEDVSGSETLKNITLHVSTELSAEVPPYEAKVIIQLLNPVMFL